MPRKASPSSSSSSASAAKHRCSALCIVHWLIAVLQLCIFAGATYGVYVVHVVVKEPTFGTIASSLTLLASAVSLWCFAKALRGCCCIGNCPR